MILKAVLSLIDLFGIPVTMNLSRSEKIKSDFGGLCSLLFLGFVGWALYNGSKDFFEKQNPKTVNSESYNDNPREITISPDNFPIAFGMQAPAAMLYQPYMNESIFTLTVYLYHLDRIKDSNGTLQEVWKNTQLITEKCTPDHFGPFYSSFSDVDLTSLYCLAQNQPGLEQIKVEGSYASATSASYQSVSITVSECTNNTTCAPEPTRSAYLSGGWFNVLFVNMVVNPNNISHPDSRYRDIYSTMISPASYKETGIQLGHVDISSDSGWIVKDIDMKNYTKANSVTESLQLMPDPDHILITCTFQASNLETYYTRVYKKIQDVLAEVAGLSNTVFVIILIIATPYSKLKLREALMNELFDMKLSPKIKQKKNKSIHSNSHNVEHENNTQSQKQTNKEPIPIIQLGKRGSEMSLPSDRGLGDAIRQLGASANILNMPKIKSGLLENRSIDEVSAPSPLQLSPNISVYSPKQDEVLLQPSIKETQDLKEFYVTKRQYSKTISWKDSPINNANNLHTNHFYSNDVSIISQKGILGNTVHLSRLAKKKAASLQPRSLNDSHYETVRARSFISKGYGAETNKIQKLTSSQDELNTDAQQKNELEQISPTNQALMSNNQNSEKIYYKEQEESKNAPGFQKTAVEKRKLNLSVLEYFISFVYKSKAMRLKLKLLEQGKKYIEERLNVLNIMKKLREVDKLKVLLLDHNELVLFDNLPKPVLKPKDGHVENKTPNLIRSSYPRTYLQRSTFIEDNANKEDALKSRQLIQQKYHKSDIDEKILEIFSNNGSNDIL